MNDNDKFPPDQTATVVLASSSAIRRKLLQAAGLACMTEAADLDEAAVKARLGKEGADAAAVAEALAMLKARHVGTKHPGAFIIGADQMLEAEGRWFDKPVDRAGARAQLQALRGRSHELVSAVCVLRDETGLWHHVARARLTMRDFSDSFLDAYLDSAGPKILQSVGAYQLEGLGVQLFERIDGDYFTILGLPLLPLLDFFRRQNVIAQ